MYEPAVRGIYAGVEKNDDDKGHGLVSAIAKASAAQKESRSMRVTNGELYANVYELMLTSRFAKERCEVRKVVLLLSTPDQSS